MGLLLLADGRMVKPRPSLFIGSLWLVGLSFVVLILESQATESVLGHDEVSNPSNNVEDESNPVRRARSNFRYFNFFHQPNWEFRPHLEHTGSADYRPVKDSYFGIDVGSPFPAVSHDETHVEIIMNDDVDINSANEHRACTHHGEYLQAPGNPCEYLLCTSFAGGWNVKQMPCPPGMAIRPELNHYAGYPCIPDATICSPFKRSELVEFSHNGFLDGETAHGSDDADDETAHGSDDTQSIKIEHDEEPVSTKVHDTIGIHSFSSPIDPFKGKIFESIHGYPDYEQLAHVTQEEEARMSKQISAVDARQADLPDNDDSSELTDIVEDYGHLKETFTKPAVGKKAKKEDRKHDYETLHGESPGPKNMHRVQVVNEPGSKQKMEEKSTFERERKPGYVMLKKTSRRVNKSSTVYGSKGDDENKDEQGTEERSSFHTRTSSKMKSRKFSSNGEDPKPGRKQQHTTAGKSMKAKKSKPRKTLSNNISKPSTNLKEETTNADTVAQVIRRSFVHVPVVPAHIVPILKDIHAGSTEGKLTSNS